MDNTLGRLNFDSDNTNKIFITDETSILKLVELQSLWQNVENNGKYGFAKFAIFLCIFVLRTGEPTLSSQCLYHDIYDQIADRFYHLFASFREMHLVHA